jgi:hypothetical protein
MVPDVLSLRMLRLLWLLLSLQVYTYTLNPLIAGEEPDSTNSRQQQQQRDLPPLPPARQQQQALPSSVVAPRSQSTVSGWELRLVMEFCDQVRGNCGSGCWSWKVLPLSAPTETVLLLLLE